MPKSKISKRHRHSVSESSGEETDSSVVSYSSVEVEEEPKRRSRKHRKAEPKVKRRSSSTKSGKKRSSKTSRRSTIIADGTDDSGANSAAEGTSKEEVEEMVTDRKAQEDDEVKHVPKFGVNAGEKPSVAPAVPPETPTMNQAEAKAELELSGINLNASQIQDLSVLSSDRMKEVTTFQLGSGYFFRVGPTPYHAQGGTYDAISFGKIIIEKEGGKPKPVSVNISLKSAPQLVEGLVNLRTIFETGRKPLEIRDLEDLKKACTTGADIDLTDRLQFVAPKVGYKIDSNHVIAGETVNINKNSSYEAITLCRLPKATGANGKPTKKFSLSFPLRFLPTLTVLGQFALQLSQKAAE